MLRWKERRLSEGPSEIRRMLIGRELFEKSA
jgi:hypothetical protein